MIKIDGLNKFFNKGRQNEIHVINDISLDLPERGMIAIFGKSGCGKTTLLNIIGGLDKYAGGSLTIEGKDIRKNT
ncbi:MAG: ATP-binding cassette domain-containing protein, partial [Ruminococcaceae bacterium]|nr:ATP-binding cassette domain-containing protein [Oscillospiraceae bacterium]